MSLHSIKNEVSFPTHLSDVHKQGIARFLWEYFGRYQVTVCRIPNEYGQSVWYFDSTSPSSNYIAFELYNLESWARDNYYSDHTFRWEDVRIINTQKELKNPYVAKAYTRHD